MIEILTIKEAEKLGTNMRVVDFKEFACEMMRYTTKFSFEGLRVLFDYFNSSCGEETIVHYGHWSQHYEECSFEDFVKIVKFHIFCDSCEPTKESIQEAFYYNQIEDSCYLVGLTSTSVVYLVYIDV